ncbi:MAG: urate hydroxylase PuuD [Betaproteobacteria bacterium]
MEAYVVEWLGFLGRGFHLVAGIAWIGASFYFIWLDSHLHAPRYADEAARLGIGGEVWALHGGGFYRAQKFAVAPPELPETLHWFKWEAYATWLSGMFVLGIVYYLGAEVMLIDRAVANLSKPGSIAIGLAFIAGGWIVYDLLCRSPLGRREPALAAVMLVLCAIAAYALTHLFSGRGAFIHFGAMLGTIMAANVLVVIMPGQREMVKAKAQARVPDPSHAARGKQRSVHNTYFTLPVLFTMISNHYAMFTNARHAWLVLIAISLAGVLVRLFFTFRHRGIVKPSFWAITLALLAAVFAWLAPRPAPGIAGGARFADVRAIVAARCAGCHADKPTVEGFASAPKNVLLDSSERIVAQAQPIHQQTVVLKAMPIGNLTAMTDGERAVIDAWFRGGAKAE